MDPMNPDTLWVFFRCLELLNSQPYQYQNVADIPNPPQVFSYAKDFLQMTAEICYAGRFDSLHDCIKINLIIKPMPRPTYTLWNKEQAVTLLQFSVVFADRVEDQVTFLGLSYISAYITCLHSS